MYKQHLWQQQISSTEILSLGRTTLHYSVNIISIVWRKLEASFSPDLQPRRQPDPRPTWIWLKEFGSGDTDQAARWIHLNPAKPLHRGTCIFCGMKWDRHMPLSGLNPPIYISCISLVLYSEWHLEFTLLFSSLAKAIIQAEMWWGFFFC